MADANKNYFAYGATIGGGDVSDFAVGRGDILIVKLNRDLSESPGNYTWWGGPDEDTYHVIVKDNPNGDTPTPISKFITAYLVCYGISPKNDEQFINLANALMNSSYSTVEDARLALLNNNYYTTKDMHLDYNDVSLLVDEDINFLLYDKTLIGSDLLLIDSGVIDVSSYGHTLYVKETGGVPPSTTIYSYGGDNRYGQLGNNSTISSSTPVAVCNASSVCKVATSLASSFYLKDSGFIYSWGYNRNGMLGDNSTIDKCTPVAVCGFSGEFQGVDIQGGSYHVIARWVDISGGPTSQGLAAWGDNGYGQLGNNSTVDISCKANVCIPARYSSCDVAVIRAGGRSSLYVDKNDDVFTWGYNLYGQLGNGTVTCRSTPHRAALLDGLSIKVGENHMIGLNSSGKVYSWGLNNYGQLGDNSISCRCEPVSIYGTNTFCKIFVSTFMNVAIDNHGTFWGWGRDVSGNFYGSAGNRSTPVRLSNFVV